MGLFPTITNLTFFLCAMKLDKTFDKTVRAGVRNYILSWIKQAVWCAFYYNLTLYRRRRTYCFSFTWKRWNASIMYYYVRTAAHAQRYMYPLWWLDGNERSQVCSGPQMKLFFVAGVSQVMILMKRLSSNLNFTVSSNIPNWKSILKRSKSHNALSTYKVSTSRLNRHLNWVNNLF